jgi:rubrerythrin
VADRARQIVARHLKGAAVSEAALAPAWRCPSCGELVEGQFQACWKCGTSKA